jgi:hypothetical protein
MFRHARESGHPVTEAPAIITGVNVYWIIRFRG